MQEKFRGIDFFFGKISKMLLGVLIMLGLGVLRKKGFKFEYKERIGFGCTKFLFTATSSCRCSVVLNNVSFDLFTLKINELWCFFDKKATHPSHFLPQSFSE
ncbi:MAG: hypothetical protein SFV55_00845 [Haliscomenobacter sp.]|uniref:hypothetical protein n=1 Tax=Haliscomenobacter sp. TaxID=2717303 RepID=UPI0029A299CB|nr:hypothetical protein [Haliscomenobacter sp.]MDX2066934.1 hypothetical protein [Haliscomenobacter sp.]